LRNGGKRREPPLALQRGRPGHRFRFAHLSARAVHRWSIGNSPARHSQTDCPSRSTGRATRSHRLAIPDVLGEPPHTDCTNAAMRVRRRHGTASGDAADRPLRRSRLRFYYFRETPLARLGKHGFLPIKYFADQRRKYTLDHLWMASTHIHNFLSLATST